MHEQHQEAPLSPIYVNLRDIQANLLTEIGHQLWGLSQERGLRFTRVTGIPKAAEPIAYAFVEAGKMGDDHVLFLEKIKDGGSRRITNKVTGVFDAGEIVLLIDDVITGAHTKIEATKALRANRLQVTDCLVIVDREQGGADGLTPEVINLHSLFGLGALLDLYIREGKTSTEQRDAVLSYRQRVEEFLSQAS
ncbi:hypothetical protein KKG41_06705 [Patescibacteria group bacterium]|nr:hypothetical protein [Patescibacteria group bacterium]